MRLILQATIALLISFAATAQVKEWHTPANNGLGPIAARFEDVFFTKPGVGFCVDLTGRVLKTSDGGDTWHSKGTSNVPFRAVEFLDDDSTGLITGLGSPGYVIRTTTAGETWMDVSDSVPDAPLTPQINDSRQICGLSHWGNTFFGVGWWGSKKARFFKSTDKGLHWTISILDTSLATSLVDVCFVSADTGFVAGGKIVTGNQSYESVILRTTDGGLSWTKVFSDAVVGGRIWKLQFIDRQHAVGAVEPLYSDTVAMVKSIDGGATWQFVGTGFQRATQLQAFRGKTQTIGFINPQHGWMGGYYSGLIETKDGGQTWDSVAFGENYNRIFVIDSDLVWAAGREIYRWGDTAKIALGTAVRSRLAEVPHILYPVVPNPAKGKVRIAFDLHNATNVVVQVVSLDARKVYEVHASRMKSGHYEYTWDAKDAPPGQYLLWLGTDEIPITQRFELH